MKVLLRCVLFSALRIIHESFLWQEKLAHGVNESVLLITEKAYPLYKRNCINWPEKCIGRLGLIAFIEVKMTKRLVVVRAKPPLFTR
jgi:hypothetical protein